MSETPQQEPAEQPTETAPEAAPDKGAQPGPDPAKLQAEVERLQALARKHEDRWKALVPKAKRLEEMEEASATEMERAVKAAREEERAQLASERSAANRRVAAAEVKSAAAGKLIDPSDAPRYLDLDSFINDDGDVDSDAIAKEIDQLVEKKPHLAVQRRVGSIIPGGIRETGRGASTTEPGMARLREAYAQKTRNHP
jgi:hypothetical protein